MDGCGAAVASTSVSTPVDVVVVVSLATVVERIKLVLGSLSPAVVVDMTVLAGRDVCATNQGAAAWEETRERERE